MMGKFNIIIFFTALVFLNCNKKSGGNNPPPPPPSNFSMLSWSVNGKPSQTNYYDISKTPLVQFKFSTSIDRASTSGSITLKENSGAAVNHTLSYANGDSAVILTPAQPLNNLAKYRVSVSTQLKSVSGGSLNVATEISFITSIDSTRKFPAISDDSLLTLVQKQTFKYFWDFGHPVSGMARERNTSGDIVTTGGTGFGIMAIPVAINRNFITRGQGLGRVQLIVNFLRNTAPKFHGVFSHWMNGVTGAVVPFAANDNGADLVETSFLIMGLLTAREYFNTADAAETTLRNDINAIWNDVEWDWFRQNGKKVLYWNWSPNFGWAVNVPVQGWNECLITYVLAASSTTHGRSE